MRIAIISDIHANLPALEAVLKSIDHSDPDAIYCLGDLVGYNVWPNEVINEIRRRKIPTIAGNYDQGIGLKSDDCGCAYKAENDKEMGKISIAYTNAIINPEERKYLRTLPAHIRLTFHAENEQLNLLLVHGSPRKINEYLFEDREEKSLLRIMEDADADIMCFGHTHKPYHRIMQQGDRFRHAVNAGAVGKPKDGDPRACYVLITIDESASFAKQDSIKVDFIRVEYDVEKAAEAIEASLLPEEYADMLRKAY
jgi:putative phosphoesterase